MASSATRDRVRNRISTVASELEVPDETQETALTLFKRTAEDPDFNLHRADPLGAAVLTTACRLDGETVPVSKVTATWTAIADDSTGTFDQADVYQKLRKVKNATGVGELPPSPEALIARFADELELSNELEEIAHRILQDANEIDQSLGDAGKSPSGLAAGALYLGVRINDQGQKFPQHRISDVADVSEVTIRNRYQHLSELLGGEEELRKDDRYQFAAI
jgi:transcription initiation factor TFIIB